MAEYKSENAVDIDDERSGGGNKNALAYGLLQGAGINTHGLSPSQAWELVSQLNLMESKRWKRTDEDKRDIKSKNAELKSAGKTLADIGKEAEKYADRVIFRGVSNVAALNEAVSAINGVMEQYELKN